MSQSKSPLLARQPGSALAIALLAAALAGCGGSGSSAAVGGGAGSAAPIPASGASHKAVGQAPVPAQSNPPGDIPDTTVYVTYHAPAGHMSVKVPEGWSRASTQASSTFTSNLNSINLAWTPMAAAPTVSSARATVRALQAGTRAFRLRAVRAVSLAGGPAVEIIYQVNSTPNPVTGRQYRLVIERFEFYRKGHGAVLSLSSAVGSDNVDPWRIVSESFRWA